MKMQCTEGTDFGKNLDINIDWPSQDEVNEGRVPSVCIDLLDLLGDALPEDSAGVFSVSVKSLFLENAKEDDAEAILSWLELWSCEIKKKFSI